MSHNKLGSLDIPTKLFRANSVLFGLGFNQANPLAKGIMQSSVVVVAAATSKDHWALYSASQFNWFTGRTKSSVRLQPATLFPKHHQNHSLPNIHQWGNYYFHILVSGGGALSKNQFNANVKMEWGFYSDKNLQNLVYKYNFSSKSLGWMPNKTMKMTGKLVIIKTHSTPFHVADYAKPTATKLLYQ